MLCFTFVQNDTVGLVVSLVSDVDDKKRWEGQIEACQPSNKQPHMLPTRKTGQTDHFEPCFTQTCTF